MLLVESVDTSNPIRNICRKTKEKKAANLPPPADLAELELCKRCCVNGKCTVNQLLKICQEDPDSIMNAFKIATAEEKCLPDVELDLDVTDYACDCDAQDKKLEPQNKYHFLMVDNSTSLNQLRQDLSEFETEVEEDHSRANEETTKSNEEERLKTILKSRLSSNESRNETVTSIGTKSTSLDNCRNIFWTDTDATDAQIPSNMVKSPKKKTTKQTRRTFDSSDTDKSMTSDMDKSMTSDTDKSMTSDNRSKSKSIAWSIEPYQASVESRARQLSLNWRTPSISSENDSPKNSRSSHLVLIMKKKKEELVLDTEIGVEPEAGEKMKRKHWPRCFKFFKRKKKTKSKTKTFWDSSNETEDSMSNY